jgi:hypothetical protein
MSDNGRTTADVDSILDQFVAELTHTAYHVALRHGAAGAWLDLEMELWHALADMVKQWERTSSPIIPPDVPAVLRTSPSF